MLRKISNKTTANSVYKPPAGRQAQRLPDNSGQAIHAGVVFNCKKQTHLNMNIKRLESEPPLATSEWGWRYHHLGIPTNKAIEGERYIPQFKFYVSGFNTSPYGIEWMRFDNDSPIHDLIKTVPHIAFEVDDLDLELTRLDFNILTPPNSPGEGIRVAMIEHNGAPIELIEFE
jgi:hypothetical protein